MKTSEAHNQNQTSIPLLCENLFTMLFSFCSHSSWNSKPGVYLPPIPCNPRLSQMRPGVLVTYYLILTSVILLTLNVLLIAQPIESNYDEGALGLGFALRRLPHTGSVLHITAHPDDEDNPLLFMLSRGRGIRTGLLTLTRGAGGQNEIGPELFGALGILRTEELMSIHRYDKVKQFFTRAYDFGYSFSVKETLQRWGRKEVLSDIVRVIRTFRPDIITILPRTGEGGGQHHQASAQLGAEAFRAAGNPNRFSEQLAQGLRPWKSKKLYERVFWGYSSGDDSDQSSDLKIQTGVEEPLLGKNHFEIGMQARSLHRCQGMAQITPLATNTISHWRLIDSNIPTSLNETDFFNGINTSLLGIKNYGNGEDLSSFLPHALEELETQSQLAMKAFHPNQIEKTAGPLANALRIVKMLRSRIKKSDLRDETKYQIGFILDQKEKEVANALRLARQLRLTASVKDGLVAPGQSFELEAHLINGGREPVSVSRIALNLPRNWKVKARYKPLKKLLGGEVLKQIFDVNVPPEANLTEPYWKRNPEMDLYQLIQSEYSTLPWRPSPVFVEALCQTDDTDLTLRKTAQFRYKGRWVGEEEQQHDLLIVPRVSVTVQPRISVIPLSQTNKARAIRVTTTYQGKSPATGSLKLITPKGWKVSPSKTRLFFPQEGQSLNSEFQLRPPPNLKAGQWTLQAIINLDGKNYSRGYQTIDYPHIKKRHLYHPAEVTVKVINAKIRPVKLGYVMGVGDKVPEALRELGVNFHLLSDKDLASDLEQYDVIMTGVRAYLSRKQLRMQNKHLLEWVRSGGTMIVQYNKFEFNKTIDEVGEKRIENSPYAPYPAQVGRGRVTDEKAKVEVLNSSHPIFTFPNLIARLDWNDWVQERGLYFLDKKDSRYQDLVSMEDTFEYNSGRKVGALVIAEYGRGKWLYIGLGLWRQLPAGVTGAYRLLANLVSLGSQN